MTNFQPEVAVQAPNELKVDKERKCKKKKPSTIDSGNTTKSQQLLLIRAFYLIQPLLALSVSITLIPIYPLSIRQLFLLLQEII